jgi:3-phenylpropionate/trans-cinnamate dioxygenase ferredoxin component
VRRSTFVRACAVADVPDESIVRVRVGGRAVAVARSEGRFYAIHDVCSHAEVPLSEGEVSGGRVECWLHGSEFDLATGRPCQPPATRPVPVYPVVVDGDDVLVALQES